MGLGRDIRRGYSPHPDPTVAVEELYDAIAQAAPGLVVFFCSSSYDLEILGTEIRRRFGKAPVIGCTTAGEITPAGYMDGSITGFSMPAHDCCAVTELIPGLSSFHMAQGHAAAERAITGASALNHPVNPKNTFALLLTDGMSTNEEPLVAAIHQRMETVPLLGGSAGDDLQLRRTHVYHDGRFHADAALLTLIKTTYPFRLLKSQHFTGSGTRMVVTAANPSRRIVTEINAEPAGLEYARIVGLKFEELTPMMFAEHPVMVKVGGDYYVRSIQKVNEDGSLTFFCAIDEGVVLTLARHEDIIGSLRDCFKEVRQDLGPPQLVIGFDCILRSLEAERRQVKRLAGQIMAENNVIGFSTYGEQFAAMHVNQTFTAAAFGYPRAG